MIDIRQTSQYANYLKKIGWEVERVADINYFIKKIPILGSVLKIQRPQEIRLNKIREFAKQYRSFQIIIEPRTELDMEFLSSVGFRLSRSPYLPTKTLILDLTLSTTRLLGSMQKDARVAIVRTKGPKLIFIDQEKVAKAEANKVVKSSKNLQYTIGAFREAWKKAVGAKRYVPPLPHLTALKQTFKNNCLFVLAEDNSSGAIFLTGDKIAYYWQAFTNKEGRKKLAQYKIVWEGIKWAKARGAKVFDFEGIYDERFPNKSWLGFTHFKKSFGGYEVAYPGCMIKTRIPL